jgi:predicted ATPase/DNA-binding CsgD family transcriptional regulator
MADREEFLHEPLTEREQQIVGLIGNGLTNQQIADQLFLTLDTVKWHNKQIYQKLGVHSRTQAIASIRQFALPGKAASVAKHNLPDPGTLFIGRSRELAEIQARLAEAECRLLTILGPGGIGKTRLAIEAARQRTENYPDGVYFVPFASVQSPDFVVQALADGVGVTLTNQRDALDKVIGYLHEKRLLLLLDNFEHLLEGVHLLAEMLARSKGVKLLVTSRERLRLKEEWVFDVQGLRYPATGEEGPDSAAYEAGQLFLWTAQRARADFVMEAGDQPRVTRICQLVGGMPLAIELAASWVRLLPCAEIERGITQDQEILTAAWRDVPERHRSIRAVLDHSWKLLGRDEQELFRRLAIFSGPFQREAAMAVTGASLAMLLSLVDKSFLRRVEPEWFGIHELLKQYGSEKLRADPEAWNATRLRHCQFHATFLHDRMSAPDAASHVDEIEQLFDDMQMAWRYAVEFGQLAEIRKLAMGFQVYYRLHGWYRAGSGAIAQYQRALAAFEPETKNPEQRATLACLFESLGDLQELATAHTDALAAFERALENTSSEEHIRHGRLYGKMADSWMAVHRYEAAHEAYTLAEAALEKEPQRDAAWWSEWLQIQTQRMNLFYWENRPQDMADLARRIHPLIEQRGAIAQRIHYLWMLSVMALRRDRYFNCSEAITYSREALALSLRTGNLGETALRHFSLGFSHLWSHQLDEAERHLQIAREMTEQNGDLTLLARALSYLGVVYRKQDDLKRARTFAAYALRVAGEAKRPEYTGMAHALFAWLAWRTDDLVKAREEAMTAIEMCGGLGSHLSAMPFRWLALFPLLGVALREENVDEAVQWTQHLLAPSQQRLPDNLTTLLEEAVAVGVKGEYDEAGDLLHQALRLAFELHYI